MPNRLLISCHLEFLGDFGRDMFRGKYPSQDKKRHFRRASHRHLGLCRFECKIAKDGHNG